MHRILVASLLVMFITTQVWSMPHSQRGVDDQDAIVQYLINQLQKYVAGETASNSPQPASHVSNNDWKALKALRPVITIFETDNNPGTTKTKTKDELNMEVRDGDQPVISVFEADEVASSEKKLNNMKIPDEYGPKIVISEANEEDSSTFNKYKDREVPALYRPMDPVIHIYTTKQDPGAANKKESKQEVSDDSSSLGSWNILSKEDEDMLLRKMSELKVAELSTPPMSSEKDNFSKREDEMDTDKEFLGNLLTIIQTYIRLGEQ